MALDVLICNPEKLGVRAFLVAFLVAIISVANGFMTSGSRFRVSRSGCNYLKVPLCNPIRIAPQPITNGPLGSEDDQKEKRRRRVLSPF